MSSGVANFPRSGADRIHLLDAGVIDRLASKQLIHFDTTVSLSLMHFVSFNDSISVADLQELARHQGLIGWQPDYALRFLAVRLDVVKGVDDARFDGELKVLLDRTYERMSQLQSEAEELSGNGIIGSHFKIVANQLSRWIGFVSAARRYVNDGERAPLDSAIASLRLEKVLPDDIGDHPYDNSGKIDRSGISYLIRSFVRNSRLNLSLGEDFCRDLNAHGIYIIEQAFD